MARLDAAEQNNDWFLDKSRQLSKASEGLPGLLVDYMKWIRNSRYIIRPGIESQRLFTSLAKPYANQNLLWTREQLWNALRKTYLLEPSQDIWVRLYPAVRRLLFRCQYPSRGKQAEAHRRVAEYYRRSPMDLSGTDKAVVLIERLWHQAECQRLDRADSAPENLLDFARELFTRGIQSNHHTDRDLAVLIEERLHEDHELQQALAEIQRGLFAEIVAIVNQYTS
jgi:ABC-type transporter Mla subunit MlaD